MWIPTEIITTLKEYNWCNNLSKDKNNTRIIIILAEERYYHRPIIVAMLSVWNLYANETTVVGQS